MSDRAETILVADGEEHILRLLELYLGREGFVVANAGACGTAMEMFAELAPDLVVLEAAMEGGKGLDVLRRIRERSAVPVIMFTAYDTPDEHDACLELGADDLVTKPFRPRDLVARVHTVLRRSRMNLGRVRVPGGCDPFSTERKAG